MHRAFADAGMRLAWSYRNEDDRAATEAWFAEKGHDKPLFLRLDVTDRAFRPLFGPGARALLTGRRVTALDLARICA